MNKAKKRSKFKIIIFIIALIIFFIGLGVFLYPILSNWQYNRSVTEITTRFNEDVEDNTRLNELYEVLKQENKKLYDEGQKDLVDPFSYQQPGIDLTEYGISDNIIGYIVIPKINETLPIHLGASKENMNLGATHLTQTSYPIGGKNTNTVIAAHRGYYKANMFRYLPNLQNGDPVYIRNFRETLTYRVVGAEIILPEQIDKVLIQPDKDMLTLFTCHPYGKNTYRYVIYCERSEE